MSTENKIYGIKLKVKVSEVTPEGLSELREYAMKKAKQFYQSHPFATKVYLSSKTSLSMKFVQDNWEEITGGKS